jgi:hypothetical protein
MLQAKIVHGQGHRKHGPSAALEKDVLSGGIEVCWGRPVAINPAANPVEFYHATGDRK